MPREIVRRAWDGGRFFSWVVVVVVKWAFSQKGEGRGVLVCGASALTKGIIWICDGYRYMYIYTYLAMSLSLFLFLSPSCPSGVQIQRSNAKGLRDQDSGRYNRWGIKG